jgi:hypothetical protein
VQAIEYGIVCNADDEKKLVKSVNAFLASKGYRKLYERVPAGLRNPDEPEKNRRYDHYYCQFLKEHPRWYFDLYPNVDLDGIARFPDHPQFGWTLYANKVMPERNSDSDDASLNAFFEDLRVGVGYPTEILHRYMPLENRI